VITGRTARFVPTYRAPVIVRSTRLEMSGGVEDSYPLLRHQIRRVSQPAVLPPLRLPPLLLSSCPEPAGRRRRLTPVRASVFIQKGGCRGPRGSERTYSFNSLPTPSFPRLSLRAQRSRTTDQLSVGDTTRACQVVLDMSCRELLLKGPAPLQLAGRAKPDQNCTAAFWFTFLAVLRGGSDSDVPLDLRRLAAR
jgi:hypothetical protein